MFSFYNKYFFCFVFRLFSQKQGIAQKLLFEQKKIAAVEKSNQKFAAQASSAGPRIGRGLETGKYTSICIKILRAFNSLIESNFFVQTVTNTYIA